MQGNEREGEGGERMETAHKSSRSVCLCFRLLCGVCIVFPSPFDRFDEYFTSACVLAETATCLCVCVSNTRFVIGRNGCCSGCCY